MKIERLRKALDLLEKEGFQDVASVQEENGYWEVVQGPGYRLSLARAEDTSATAGKSALVKYVPTEVKL